MNILKKIKNTQKITIITLLILIFNMLTPVYSNADVGGSLATPITYFITLLLDAVEGGLQYFFVGGPVAGIQVMYNPDDAKAILDELPNNGDPDRNSIQREDKGSFEGFLDKVLGWGTEPYNVPVTKYSPGEIFSNQIAAFNINFIDPIKETSDTQGSIASKLQPTIASWYKALRMLAFVGMLSVLVYVGIRIIISSTASDKAKYKNMIMDWVVAVCLLFFMHYIMEFTIVITDSITAMVNSANKDFEIQITEDGEDIEDAKYRTNLMGLVRFRCQYVDLVPELTYIIIYGIMIVYTVMFTFTYLKRVLMMAFLTVISPLVVITYPIDKISDGQAQGFNTWLKEYIFNALLQPIHLILYTVLIGSAIDLAADNPIYAIVAMLFLLPAEQILRKIFNFSKASAGTMGAIGGFAGGAALMSMINNRAKNLGKGKSSGGSGGNGGSSGEGNKIKTFSKPNLGAFAPGKGGAQGKGALPGGNAALGEGQGNDSMNVNGTVPAGAEGLDGAEGAAGLEAGGVAGLGAGPDGTPPEGLATGEEARKALETAQAGQPEGNRSKIRGFRSGAGAVARRYVGPNVKKMAKFAAKAGVGGLAGAGLGALGLMAGAATGDMSKAFQMAAAGAGAGIYAGAKGVSGAAKLGSSAASGAGKIRSTFEQGKYGLAEAKKLEDSRTLEKQKKEFMKNKDNVAKYKDMAASMGTNDYKKLMEDSFKLQSYGVKEDNVKSAIELARDEKLNTEQAAAVAIKAQKIDQNILYQHGERLQASFEKEIMAKSGASKKVAQDKAKEVMRHLQKFHGV